MQYVADRAEGPAPSDDATAQLASRIEQLESRLSALMSYTGQLEDTIRQMQIGLRRHRSERVDPNQLTMALHVQEPSPKPKPPTEACNTPAPDAAQCDSARQPATSGHASAAQACQQTGDACSSPPPKKRHRHGRRKVGVVPQLIVHILPPEALVDGIAAFDQIGHEDTSVVGYRRGGPMEVVFRRLKLVRRQSSASQCASDAEASSAADVSAQRGSASDRPEARSDAATPTSDRDARAVEVFEHEFLCVPDDPAVRHNPFVDGAIVRYFPAPTAVDGRESKVLIAPPPQRPIDKGLADTSLLAHLFVDKQDRHLPYYRQEAELEQFGWPISRANMARWQYECGQLVRPLVDGMWQQALARSWFAMDATGTAIRGSPKYERGHIFVLVAEGQSILYRFSATQDGATVNKLFGDSSATILADASSCHNGLFGPGKATEAGCWAHARRRMIAAFRAGEGAEPAAVLQTMQSLFRIEREIADLEPAQRLEVREQRSAPLVDALLSLAAVRRKELPADSLTRKGFVYLDNQRGPLREFLRNGELPISNNVSERELRRHVKGRINWLFHSSAEHAHSACAISSLVASAELQGLDPELYLQEILTVIATYPVNRVLELSPENWLDTRQRLIADGRLKYLDLARATGSALSFRPR